MTALLETVDVDLDADVPCAVPDCHLPAAWLYDNLACECTRGVPICDPHKLGADVAFYLALLVGLRAQCAQCEVPTIARWRPL